jgi:hypothetical protein
LRKQIAATAALAGVGEMYTVELKDVAQTSDGFFIVPHANAGFYDQIIRRISDPTFWVDEGIKECVKRLIRYVGSILVSPALLNWTERKWATFLDWLQHVEIMLIHLRTTRFH